MNAIWLKQNGADRLIIAFGGWALGPAPFGMLAGDEDVLFFDDYRSLDAPAPDCEPYKTVSILTYSFGVASCLHWLEHTGFSADRLIAVNGTPCPADAEKGIAPERVRATATALSEASFARFCRRAGMETPPEIGVTARQDELLAIAARGNATPRKFDRIWISSKDRIIPPAAQHSAWKDQADRICEIDAPHLPFRPGQSWQEWLS